MFIFFISLVILSRIGELLLSGKNEKWLLQSGAIEYGKEHYPYIITLHILFFPAVILEYSLQKTHSYSLLLLILCFSLLACKAWVIMSLGKFWNTKIYRIPGISLINNGPYRYIKHPNYLLVVGEIAAIPLAFHLYYTAVIFTLLNAAILLIRIKEENKVLQT